MDTPDRKVMKLMREYGKKNNLTESAFAAQFFRYARGLQWKERLETVAMLEPSSPGTYGTSVIMKAIHFANAIGINDVVTTETEPMSDRANSLSYKEKIFIIAEKLHMPCKMAADCGINILLEPHGPITNSIQGLRIEGGWARMSDGRRFDRSEPSRREIRMAL